MPIFGVTRLANVTGLDTIGLPVVMSVRPNARSLAVSQGKGVTLAAAKASALMEAIELYHAERVLLPVKFATHNELRYTHQIAALDALPQRRNSPFHANRRVLWIESVDLLNDRATWLPHELVHTDMTVPLPPGAGCFPLTSNGLASGNDLREAALHACCEVIERHDYATWEYAGGDALKATRIDPATIHAPVARGVLERYATAGVRAGIWETTSTIGVPSFRCLIVQDTVAGTEPIPVAAGMGCHPVPEVALTRALTEAAQTRLTLISGARDDQPRSNYAAVQAPEVAAQAAQLLDEPAAGDFAATVGADHDDIADDLQWVLDRLRAAGADEVLMVDLTREEFDISVCRIVVPGLEPMPEMDARPPRPLATAIRRMVPA
jgi:ribosomal protein S12 methylthiotransferase accessory factor